MSLYGFRTQKQRKRWRLRITISQHYSTEHILYMRYIRHGRTFAIQEDDTKSADFMPSSQVVIICPRRDACAVTRVHNGIG